jgi:hypothetical protein
MKLSSSFHSPPKSSQRLAKLSQSCWWAKSSLETNIHFSTGLLQRNLELEHPFSFFPITMVSNCICFWYIWISQDSGDGSTTTFSGLLCLMGYMLFDSFTSNWQSEVFKYKMSSMEMMFGVNVFSCIFTSWSLISQGNQLKIIKEKEKTYQFRIFRCISRIYASTSWLHLPRDCPLCLLR